MARLSTDVATFVSLLLALCSGQMEPGKKNAAKLPDCLASTDLESQALGSKKVELVWQNELNRDIEVYWIGMDKQRTEHFTTNIGAGGRETQFSYAGHCFRARISPEGTVVSEYCVPDDGKNRVLASVTPCGTVDEPPKLWAPGRDAEFEALAHDPAAPCEPADDSRQWSCVRLLSPADVAARNSSDYGFQPSEIDRKVEGGPWGRGRGEVGLDRG